MPTSPMRLTETAITLLVLVVAGTVMLVIMTILLRQQRHRYYQRVNKLLRQYRPAFAKVLAGKHSARALATLHALPLGDRELLCEPWLSRGGLKPFQLAMLRALCEELGLIAIWQGRLSGDCRMTRFLEAVCCPRRLLDWIRRLNFLPRVRSARNLGVLCHRPSWKLLIEALNDPHPGVQSVALRSLASLRAPQSFPTLVERLQAAVLDEARHPSPRSLQAALASFPVSLSVELRTSLRHPHAQIRSLAIDILREMMQHAGGAEGNFIPVRELLPEGLSEILLGQLARDESPEVRGRAAEVITYLDPARSTPALCGLLRDPQWFVRLRTLRALGKGQHLSALTEIRRCLVDPHWRVREAALQTLLALGSDGTSQLFEQFLNPLSRASREHVMEEAARIGLIPALLGRHKDDGDSQEHQRMKQLLNVGATSYLLAELENGSGPQARQKCLELFGQHRRAQRPAQAEVAVNLTGDRRAGQLTQSLLLPAA